MTMKLLRSTRLCLSDSLAPGAVRVRGRVIEEVREWDAEPLPGEPVIDLGDWVLMPALIDTHVHINEPGRTEWEGLATASRAAVAGGIGTVVDMPLNCSPVSTKAKALRDKMAVFAGRSKMETHFWAGLVHGNARELEKLFDAGAIGAKAFLVHSGIDEFTAATESDLRKAMPIIRDYARPLLVHAELDVPPYTPANPRSHAEWVSSRPPETERAAVEMLIRLSREYRCHVHIVHVAAAEVLPLIRDAKDEGLMITAETCPHYLAIDTAKIPDGATEFKCAPPIRGERHREALWEALEDGTLDMIVSDHSPSPPELKHRESGDFFRAWGGIASLQLGLPVVWTAARARGFTIREIVHLMSTQPAELASLCCRKGIIAPRFDADLVAFDPDATFTVRGTALHHRHKLTPYEGRELCGVVRRVWLGGEEITPETACPK